MISVGIITVSDRVFRKEYEDKGGPALKQFCEKRGWQVVAQAVVLDEEAVIGDKTRELTRTCSLILLTGGTGIAERDVTPEAIHEIATKELPGFGEVMRAKSFERFPHAILSTNHSSFAFPEAPKAPSSASNSSRRPFRTPLNC